MYRVVIFIGLTLTVADIVAAPDPVSSYRSRSAESTDSESDASGLIEGFTEPYADINLAAAEMGTLADVSVRDGDEVTRGQLIAELDCSVLFAARDVATAGAEAQGELQSAQANFELKSIELQKLSELFSRNHASHQELDRIRGEVAVAEGRLKAVQEDLHVRRLELARIEAQIRQRQIRSTIDGVVVDVLRDRGEFVSPSDPVVARIVQLNPLLVVFSVPGHRRQDVQTGQTVNMQIGQHPSTTDGVVEYVSPTTDASSGTFRVKVRLPNPERIWYGGEKSLLLLDGPVPTTTPEHHMARKELR
ncbi:MAG: efflux RND transporter periplasmic adaptor subunit [Planctomycetaceae bacterium]